MAAVDNNPLVQAQGLRVARLSATGAPVSGAGNGYQTDGIIQLQETPEIDNGTDIEVTLANGEKCVNVPGQPTIKWKNLELTICGVEDELFELIAGNLLIQSGGNTIGNADPDLGAIANPYGISLELWQKMMVGGSQDPTYPWARHIWPKTYGWVKGQATVLNGHTGWIFTGKATENPGMPSDGPFNDWADSDSIGQVHAMYRTASSPPSSTVGYVAVPA